MFFPYEATRKIFVYVPAQLLTNIIIVPNV